MKKLFVFLGSVAVLFAARPAFAQTLGPTGKPTKMGVVDMQRISQESLLGDSWYNQDGLVSTSADATSGRKKQRARVVFIPRKCPRPSRGAWCRACR